MHYVYQHQVCVCGSHSLYEHQQLQVQGGVWSTLTMRQEDPSLIISPEQSLVAIGDSTWVSCSVCDARIDSAQALAWRDKAWEGADLKIMTEVGLGVFNPRGLERLRLSSK